MIEWLAPLVIFLFPLAYSPGPGNIFFAAVGARFGLAASLPVTVGYHLATWIVAFVIGLGFAKLITQLPALLTLIKYAGATYVFYLAWTFFRAGAVETSETGKRAGFRDGVILLLLNPKAYLIISLMFTHFMAPEDSDPLLTVFLIATVFTLNNLMAFTIWTIAGDLLGRWFRNPRSASMINSAFAFTLAGVAFWMLVP